MTVALNPEMVKALASVFPLSGTPAFAWGNIVSMLQLYPCLHAFWPCSAHHDTHVNVYVDDIACGYDLTLNGAATFQMWAGGLPPCIRLASATTDYFAHADDAQYDILGTDVHVLAAQRGLTLGGWFRWHDRTGQQALMSKWTAVGNMRSYRLMKDAAHNPFFEVSSLGTAASVVTVTSTVTVVNDVWYHIMGRFVPSLALDIYVDAVITTDAAAIPANIFHSNSPFEVGRSDGTDYANIYASLLFLAASRGWDGTAATRNLLPFAYYQHARKLFGK
jgi:hypothetical protein